MWPFLIKVWILYDVNICQAATVLDPIWNRKKVLGSHNRQNSEIADLALLLFFDIFFFSKRQRHGDIGHSQSHQNKKILSPLHGACMQVMIDNMAKVYKACLYWRGRISWRRRRRKGKEEEDDDDDDDDDDEEEEEEDDDDKEGEKKKNISLYNNVLEVPWKTIV